MYSALQPADIATDRLLELLRLAVQQVLAEVVKALCHTTAAVQLSVAPMVGLLKLAVKQQQCDTAAQLLLWFQQWQWRTKQQWSHLLGDDIFELMVMAAEWSCRSTLTVLQQVLDTQAAASLLQMALAFGSDHKSVRDPQVYEALCSLPALQQLQPQHAVELLLHAEQDGNTAAVSAISKCLPAAAQLAAAHNAG